LQHLEIRDLVRVFGHLADLLVDENVTFPVFPVFGQPLAIRSAAAACAPAPAGLQPLAPYGKDAVRPLPTGRRVPDLPASGRTGNDPHRVYQQEGHQGLFFRVVTDSGELEDHRPSHEGADVERPRAVEGRSAGALGQGLGAQPAGPRRCFAPTSPA